MPPTTRKAATVPDTTPATLPAPATATAPTVGRIVLYRLSADDAKDINRRRKRFKDAPANAWGFQGPVGNHAKAGQVFAADVVSVSGSDTVNLQVKLDGTDTLWATSRTHGDDDGQWIWPARS